MEVLEDIIEFIKNDDGDIVLKILKGKYSDLVIKYGDVMMFPVGEESSNGNIQFTYEILENPNAIEEDDKFYDFFGAIALDVVENYLSPLVKNIDLEEYNLQGTDEELKIKILDLKEKMTTERSQNG